MNPFIYLFIRTLKNRFKELLKHPSKLVTLIILAVFIILSAILSFFIEDEKPFRNIQELYVIVLGFYGFLYASFCLKGLKGGASFFSMADANLLFTSPLSSKRILRYGLIKQMSASLILAFFLIFQYFWMKYTYGLGILGLVIILLTYTLLIFSGQLSTMAIWSFTSGNIKNKMIIKICLYTLIFLIIGAIGITFILSFDTLSILTSYFIFLIPISGWLGAIFVGVISGTIIYVILGLVLIILFIILVIFLINRYDADYYEDVLKTIEVSFSAITARQEGKIMENIPDTIKVGKSGLNKGYGAFSFYHKHRKESKRARIFLIDMMGIIVIIAVCSFAFIVRKDGLISAFMFSLYMSFLTSGTSRWARELTMPYIYMVPEKPINKLFFLTLESIQKVLVMAIIMYTIIGFITKAPIYDVVGAIIAYTSFNILFISITILSERILGNINNKGATFGLFILLLLVISLPGIIGGVLLSQYIFPESANTILFLSMSIWNLIVSAIIFFLCRNILTFAELNNK